jgi:hypothetical protein
LPRRTISAFDRRFSATEEDPPEEDPPEEEVDPPVCVLVDVPFVPEEELPLLVEEESYT